MADNVPLTAGDATGGSALADEVTDGVLGTGKAQVVKIMDATINSTNKLIVDSHGSINIVNRDSSGNEIIAGAQLPVAPTPRAAANGASTTRIDSAATTNGQTLKAAAGNIVNIELFNLALYTVFVKFYNKSAAVVVGTDTPVWTMPIPAGGSFSKEYVLGLAGFTAGIGMAITKVLADSDTTVIAAHDVVGRVDWI